MEKKQHSGCIAALTRWSNHHQKRISQITNPKQKELEEEAFQLALQLIEENEQFIDEPYIQLSPKEATKLIRNPECDSLSIIVLTNLREERLHHTKHNACCGKKVACERSKRNHLLS